MREREMMNARPAPLFLIPVRGGSKGIPGKNLRTVAGISLIGRAVRAALRGSQLVGGGRVVVDTDSPELRAEAVRWGAEAPYLRPSELATDDATSVSVVRHALSRLGLASPPERAVVLLQATSPLSTPEHIAECVSAFWQGRGRAVVSVAHPATPPAQCYRRSADGVVEPLFPEWSELRRQEVPETFALTGAVYVAAAGHLAAGSGFFEPGATYGVALDRLRSVDVDEPTDLLVAEALAAANGPGEIHVGERPIGPGHPCFIIAEAGVNHDGDVDEAHRLVDASADAGADAVKFQTWKTELLCRPGAPTADYQRENANQTDQFAMLKALELPYEAHAALKAHAEARGLVFLSTPDELESAEFLVKLGVDAIKIGSGEVDNLLFLSQLARFKKPLLLSTGMADMVEVAAAVDTILANGSPPFALFHTLSNYPAPVDQMNVRAIDTLRRAFGVPVGLSDHTLGPETVMVAVGVGVDLWEKHITMDTTRPGPDHLASLEPGDFKRQVVMLRAGEQARGDGQKRAQPSELPTRRVVRKRLFAARTIRAGQQIGPEDVVALRAEVGVSAASWPVISQRVATEDIPAGAPLKLEALATLPDNNLLRT